MKISEKIAELDADAKMKLLNFYVEKRSGKSEHLVFKFLEPYRGWICCKRGITKEFLCKCIREGLIWKDSYLGKTQESALKKWMQQNKLPSFEEMLLWLEIAGR